MSDVSLAGPAAAGVSVDRTRFGSLALPGCALGYTLFVILFGAVVRITGSGAGCGQHWPTCHGEVSHLPQSVETAIELTHRVTSGLAFLLVVVLALVAQRRFPSGHLAKRAAWWSVAFMIGESLIGAALVLFELVAHNDSPSRALVMAVHLANTLFLVTALGVSAWAWQRPLPSVELGRRRTSFFLGFGLMLLVSLTGAVTALGDTLYPVQAGQGLNALRSGPGEGLHFLEQLRILHPVCAALAAVFLVQLVLQEPRSREGGSEWRFRVLVVLCAQLVAGVVNIWLNAPGALQVLHLALANLLWLCLLFLFLDGTKTPTSAVTPSQRRG